MSEHEHEYGAAVRFLNQAAAAMRAGMYGEARTRLARAEEIVDGLTVPVGAGDAERFRETHLFARRLVDQAGRTNDPQAVLFVAGLLEELRAALAAAAGEPLPAA